MFSQVGFLLFFPPCNHKLKWTWQSCSPLSVGFLSGPRKSAGETEQTMWSPDAAALQGSSANTTHSLNPKLCHEVYMNLQLRYKCRFNSVVQRYSCWLEQIINQGIDKTEHENIFSIIPRLLLPEGGRWTAGHTGKRCQPSGYGHVKNVGS